MEQQASLIRQEYDAKISEIEREREQFEEDKAQAEHFKYILTEYQDILGAITHKINERDEHIAQMQEELDAYDRIQRETEQVIEQKSQRVSQLEEYISEKLQQPLPSKTESQDSSLNSMQALRIQELEQML